MKLKALMDVDLAFESYKTSCVYITWRSSAFNILVLEMDMGTVAQKRPT